MTRRLIKMLPFVLVTLICIGGVEFFYGVIVNKYMHIPPPSQLNAGKRPSENRKQEGLIKRQNHQVILRRNIFNAFLDIPKKKEVKKEEITIANLEATTLDVILLGTITGDDGDMRAVIYDKSQRKQDLYAIEDDIKGAIIKKIIRGKVVLNYKGKDEVLDMTDSGEYRPPAASVRPSSAVRRRTTSSRQIPKKPINNVRRPRQIPRAPIRRIPPTAEKPTF